jgi:nucleotide-binding universal stress UspA family protein
MKLDKILVPTDFSPSSEPAQEFAVELARSTGASITLVHVYNPTPYEIPEGMPISGIVNVDGVIAEFRKLLEAAKQRALQAGAARVDTLLAQGTAYAEIVRIAEQQGYGMIVIGTHGRTGFAHMLLGSVAEKVVRRAPCPVITVPQRSRAQKPA